MERDSELTPLNITTGLNLTFETNTTYELVELTISNATNLASLKAEISKIASLRLDYLIYPYSKTVASVAANLNLPYLIWNYLDPKTEKTPQMFYYYNPEGLVAPAIVALLKNLKVTTIINFDNASQVTTQNLVSFNNFKQTVVLYRGTTEADFDTLFTQILKDMNLNSDTYLLNIPMIQKDAVTNFLRAAMKKGQLNTGKRIIINYLARSTFNFIDFSEFQCVPGEIFVFQVNVQNENIFSSPTALKLAIIRDYIRLVLKSVEAFPNSRPTNLIERLKGYFTTDGIINSQYGFDKDSNQMTGVLIDIKKLSQVTGGSLLVKQYNINITDVAQANAIIALSETSVRIAVILSTGYFMKKPDGRYYGYSIDLLKRIQQLSPFNYTFVFPNVSVTGENYDGLNHTGIIKMLQDNEADMTIIPMITTKIVQDVYISDPIGATQITMLTRPASITVRFTTVLQPFSYNTWICILGMIIIMSFGFWILEALSHVGNPKRKKISPRIGEKSFLVIYSSFVMAKLKIQLNLTSLQIFAFLFWFSTLTLIITYASNLLPFLIQPFEEYPFKKIDDFVNGNPSYKLVFSNNSVIVDLLKAQPNISSIFNRTIEFVDDSNTNSSLFVNKNVLIQNAQKNGYLYHLVCDTDIMVATDDIYQVSIVMRKLWDQRIQMRQIISQLIALGIPNSLNNLYFGSGSCARIQTISANPQILGPGKLIGLFVLPCAGIFFGILYVLCVFCVKKIKTFQKNRSRQIFEVGESYEGTVHSLEHNGIWVFFKDRQRPYFIHISSLYPAQADIHTPQEMGVEPNQKLFFKYFGKDQFNNQKRFCLDFEKNDYESHV